MATYLKPSMMKEHAREIIPTDVASPTYADVQEKVQEDEQLVLALGGLAYGTIYPVVHREARFKEYWEQYEVYGDFTSVGFLAVKKSELESLINTGD